MTMARKNFICFSIILSTTTLLFGQTDDLNQFWNEYAFTKDLSQNWVLELDAGLNSSSTPTDSNIFHNITRVYLRGWAHYYPDERWKVSVFYAYYMNHHVPELNQEKAPESKIAVQAIYNLFKSDHFKVNLRGRIEDRHIANDQGYIEAVERFRLQLKAIYYFNSVKKNALYAFASEEIMFKTRSQVCGPDLFDRNRISLGVGSALTDAIQVEVAYVNEIMPREGADKLVNAIQLKVIFNNFFPNLIKSFKRTKKAVDDGSEGL